MTDEKFKLLDERIRREDEDRWLSSRYASKADRKRLIALYALNLELAKVRTIVSEPGIAAIRFQWWRDAAAEIKAGKLPRKHDVVEAVAEAQILEKTMLGLIDGHEAAYEAKDRTLEPEALLMRAAVAMLAPLNSWGENISSLGPAYAATRRGETEAIGPVFAPAPAPLRPAIAHATLRFVYATGEKPGPLKKRFMIMRAMLNGRV